MIDSKKKCPSCAEKVMARAIVCKHCGHQFRGEYSAEEIKQQQGADYRTRTFAGLLVVGAVLVMIFQYG